MLLIAIVVVQMQAFKRVYSKKQRGHFFWRTLNICVQHVGMGFSCQCPLHPDGACARFIFKARSHWI